MYIPIVKKVTKSNDVLVERAMPKNGELVATVGDVVEPFTKLGMTKVSYGRLPLSKSFRPSKGRSAGSFLYTGDVLGKLGRKSVVAPYDGTLLRLDDGTYVFQQEDRDFWLLAGVWGTINSVAEKKSVLIKTQTRDIHLAVSTTNSVSGELIVFPNPSELLEMQYLQKFSKDSFGKITYTGDHISLRIVKKAYELGIAGLVAGSVDREALIYAKKKGMFLGAISGFGYIPTPGYIFDILKMVSNRYVFLQGGKGLLRIPESTPFEKSETRTASYTGQLRALKKGLVVQVFEEPYFGWLGSVFSVQDGAVQVNIDEGKDPVKIEIPNIISLE